MRVPAEALVVHSLGTEVTEEGGSFLAEDQHVQRHEMERHDALVQLQDIRDAEVKGACSWLAGRSGAGAAWLWAQVNDLVMAVGDIKQEFWANAQWRQGDG